MKIELCVHEIAALPFAQHRRIDRIELCRGLECGGLSPSPEMLRLAQEKYQLETHVLIRPRAGNFNYSGEEKELMLQEAKELQKAGARHFVIGALQSDGTLDLGWLREFRTSFPKTTLTFHRAIDDCSDWENGIEQLKTLGFKRVLSAGGAHSALEGINRLQQMKEMIGKDLELMAGGGISPQNVSGIIQILNPDAVHFSACSKRSGKGLFDQDHLSFDQHKFEGILEQIV
ncbi:MAG: hypothetical protein EP338_02675 [Bacteroidetes bacterium]|nr:MAG: hypothetical protein EP338_02675 [Bacteroidota bacterium]